MDAYGTRLAKTTSPDWDGQSSTELEVEVVWPKGSNVAIQALWHIDGTVVSADATYVSGEALVETSSEWPIGAMLWELHWVEQSPWFFACGPKRVLNRTVPLPAKHPFRKRPRIRHRNTKKSERFRVQNATDACVSLLIMRARLDAPIAPTNSGSNRKKSNAPERKKRMTLR